MHGAPGEMPGAPFSFGDGHTERGQAGACQTCARALRSRGTKSRIAMSADSPTRM